MTNQNNSASILVSADFHIHSCLSPCASLLMSPNTIAKKAKESGLNMIALTDHNSALNCAVTMKLCNRLGINCLPGMEVQTSEEVHILCIFNRLEEALELGDIIYSKLPNIHNDPVRFGDQVFVNENEVILGSVDKYLGNAASINISELLNLVRNLGGLFIPAHIDRPMFSMTSQLGFLPLDGYDAVELTRNYLQSKNQKSIRNIENYAQISNSDSHYPEMIGSTQNVFELQENSFECLKEIFRNKQNKIIFK